MWPAGLGVAHGVCRFGSAHTRMAGHSPCLATEARAGAGAVRARCGNVCHKPVKTHAPHVYSGHTQPHVRM